MMSKHISDEEIRKHNQPLLDRLNKKVVPRSEPLFGKKTKEEEDKSGLLSLEEVKFLEHLNEFPLLSTTQRKNKLGFSTSKQSRIRKKVASLGYTRQIKVNRGGRGGVIKLIALTEKGKAFLKKKGVKVRKHRGGLEHFYFVQAAAGFYEGKGWKILREEKMGKVYVDLLAVKKGISKVIEVETSNNQGTSKKIPIIYDQVDEIVIAASTGKLKKKLAREVKDELVVKELPEGIEVIRAQKFTG